MRRRNEKEAWRWALPPKLKAPPDELRARIDIFSETVVLRLYEKGVVTTKPVSALDVAQAIFSEIPIGSGILPAPLRLPGSAPTRSRAPLPRPPAQVAPSLPDTVSATSVPLARRNDRRRV